MVGIKKAAQMRRL